MRDLSRLFEIVRDGGNLLHTINKMNNICHSWLGTCLNGRNCVDGGGQSDLETNQLVINTYDFVLRSDPPAPIAVVCIDT